MSVTQISAYISDDTKALVEAYSKKKWRKKRLFNRRCFIASFTGLKRIPTGCHYSGKNNVN